MAAKRSRSLLYIVLFCIGGSLLLLTLHRLEQLEMLHNAPDKPPKPMTVFAEQVTTGPISSWIHGEGTLRAVQKRHLLFRASGQVSQLGKDQHNQPLHEGSLVQGPSSAKPDGQLLAKLDDRELQEELRIIEAERNGLKEELKAAEILLEQSRKNQELSKKRLLRRKKLFDKKIASKEEFETESNSYENATTEFATNKIRVNQLRAQQKGILARLEQAQINLEKSSIRAPFDGIINRLNIAEGDYIDPAQVDQTSQATLFATAPITISNPHQMEVILDLPIFDGIKAQKGQKAFIHRGSLDFPSDQIDKDQGITIAAKVHSVSPALDERNRSLRITVRTSQIEEKLLQGMFVSCWIEIEHQKNVLLIPTDSLLFENDTPYVYVVEQGTAQKRGVTIGQTDKDQVAIKAGLSATELVITKGKFRIFPGQAVTIATNQLELQDE